MTHDLRRQVTAWLGLMAMCLVAFAPTVSHLVRAARTVTVPVCTVDGQPGEHRLSLSSLSMPAASAVAMTVMAMNGMAGMQHDVAPDEGGAGHADHGAHGAQPLEDCGYCNLLNHTPTMSMVAPAPLAPLLLLFAVFILPGLRRFIPLGAFPSGRPRAPPVVS